MPGSQRANSTYEFPPFGAPGPGPGRPMLPPPRGFPPGRDGPPPDAGPQPLAAGPKGAPLGPPAGAAAAAAPLDGPPPEGLPPRGPPPPLFAEGGELRTPAAAMAMRQAERGEGLAAWVVCGVQLSNISGFGEAFSGWHVKQGA